MNTTHDKIIEEVRRGLPSVCYYLVDFVLWRDTLNPRLFEPLIFQDWGDMVKTYLVMRPDEEN